MKKRNVIILSLLTALTLTISGCGTAIPSGNPSQDVTHFDVLSSDTNTFDASSSNAGLPERLSTNSISLTDIPAYTNKPYTVLHDNIPDFIQSDYTETSFETYSDLDSLGRCGVAFANVGVDIMPTEDRGDIGHVKPTGWQTAKYDVVEGKYLYNRCHLIGFQLTGENANKKNLITGTRYFNVDGMLPFENMIADYVKETENHVLYRVTPMYEGNNLVATGVQMEAWSVEDNGEGICFNVFVYNIQPGVTIDYATGNSSLASEKTVTTGNTKYILNTSGKKFHIPDCSSATATKAENKKEYTGNREDLISQGYVPCGKCNP